MKCGNCNVEFQNQRAMIAHMYIIHGSRFDLPSHPQYAADDTAVQSAVTPAGLTAITKVLGGQ